MKITVVICTLNRSELLKECLDSLVGQTASPDQFDVIVIDNNSTDDTPEVVKTYVDQYPNYRYLKETNQGLSYARNRGWRESKTEWVIFLDDDAKAKENFVERGIWMAENHDYRIFGGVFLPWYKYGRPYWIQDKYHTNKLRYKKPVTLLSTEAASGGVMAVQKSLMAEYNGFDTEIGMKGNQLGYSEETAFQYQLRKDGIQVGYDPEFIIYHLVAKYKLQVDWYFSSAFALGRDMVKSGMVGKGFWTLLGHALLGIGVMLKDLIMCTPRLLSKNYHIETWILDVFRKMAKRIGIVYTGIMLTREKEA